MVMPEKSEKLFTEPGYKSGVKMKFSKDLVYVLQRPTGGPYSDRRNFYTQ